MPRKSKRQVSKPQDVGLDNLVALEFDRRLGTSTAEAPDKFPSDAIILTPNLATTRLRGIW